MKKLSFLFLFFTLVATCWAQGLQGELDSLSRAVQGRKSLDTAMVDLRNLYAKKALFADPTDTGLLGYVQKTLELSKVLGYDRGNLMAHERLALIHQYSHSDPYRAQEAYQQALSIAEGDPALHSLKWGIHGGIGTLFYEQEEYGKALAHFERVLNNEPSLELTAVANMANIHGSMGQLDSAIQYYKRALRLERKLDNPTYRANLYSNLSLIFGQTGQQDSALAAAQRALALVDRYGIEFVRPTAYANAAMAYLGTADHRNAAKYAQGALALSEESGNLFMQKSAWGTLADLHEAQGDHRAALEAFKKFSSLKDSLNGQNRRVAVNRKQLEYNFERERATAQQEILRQATIKRVSLIGGGGLLLALIFGFVLYKRKRDALERQKEAEFSALVSDTELKALRAQMNPHFIFNSLNSIGDYILKNDTDTALDYLGKFARLMRMVLENSESREIPLGEDLKFIELYMQVEHRRQPGRFTHEIRLGGDLDPDNILVPPLILQPFLENSIWHGFVDQNVPGHILVDIQKEGNTLVCVVEDDGRGRSGAASSGQGNRSYGLSITQNRLEVLNREKGSGATLLIGDREQGGTRVEVRLPLLTEF